MTPATIIQRAAADGVNLHLSHAGTIKATGEGAAVNRWLSLIREHKPGIVAALQREVSDDALPDPAAEARRQRTPRMPAGRPDLRRGEQIAELRHMVEAIARMAPAYWTRADIEEAVAIGATDLDNALMTFRALAEGYEVHLVGSQPPAHGVCRQRS